MGEAHRVGDTVLNTYLVTMRYLQNSFGAPHHPLSITYGESQSHRVYSYFYLSCEHECSRHLLST